MTETTFTFRVDEELKEAFAAAAKAQDRTSAQLLRVLMRQAIEGGREKAEYDKWFLEQVDIGLKEADDPKTVWISHEDIKKEWAKEREELLARIGREGSSRDAAE